LNVGEIVETFKGAVRFQDEPTGPRGSIQLPSGGVITGETVISLFQGADLSTFLHETGHFTLEVFTALASDEAAPESMKADLAAIREHLGIEDDAAPTRVQHETWDAAICNPRQIGTTPKTPRYSLIKANISETGGRAPLSEIR
jgi:hypothetical protein